MATEPIQLENTKLDCDNVQLGDFLRRDQRVYPHRFATENHQHHTLQEQSVSRS